MNKSISRRILAAALFLTSSSVLADQTKWIETKFPFQLSLNMDTVYQITHTEPKKLVSEIQKSGVAIFLVKDTDSKVKKNPDFSKLKYASQELLKKAEFNSIARMILASSPCCDLKQDVILIQDTASNYTLIHEYLHSLMKFEGQKPVATIEGDYRGLERKQQFYQRKLFEYSEHLLNPLWRRDILEAQGGIIALLSDRFRMGQVQEAVIEKVLARYIDSKNVNFDQQRREEGLKFAELSIDNMIAVYNNLDFSVTWNKNTVANQRAALAAKEIHLVSEKESLTEKEAEDFKKKSDEYTAMLQPIKKEILLLKKFFTESK